MPRRSRLALALLWTAVAATFLKIIVAGGHGAAPLSHLIPACLGSLAFGNVPAHPWLFMSVLSFNATLAGFVSILWPTKRGILATGMASVCFWAGAWSVPYFVSEDRECVVQTSYGFFTTLAATILGLMIVAFRRRTTTPCDATTCSKCSYDRTGLPLSSPCPECGAPHSGHIAKPSPFKS